mgnify:CR=1 FL=1
MTKEWCFQRKTGSIFGDPRNIIRMMGAIIPTHQGKKMIMGGKVLNAIAILIKPTMPERVYLCSKGLQFCMERISF